jgi:hypothetical protein
MEPWSEVKKALGGQLYAGLTMLRQCIERCPDDLWNEAPWPRSYWRIAYHAIFYAHFYLQPDCESMPYWEKHDNEALMLWDDDEADQPRRESPYSRDELLGYLDEVVASIDSTLEKVDLGSSNSGFPWYPIPKLDHEILNIRHLQGHVGQLSELLMARGIDTDWVGTHPSRRLPK